jgi:cysteine desulfurase/selenocysteine lyase
MPLVRSYDVVAAARASFYIYNTTTEVDALVNGIREAEGYFIR